MRNGTLSTRIGLAFMMLTLTGLGCRLFTGSASSTPVTANTERPTLILPTFTPWASATPTADAAECMGEPSTGAYNHANPESSSACGGGGYLYQSFLAPTTEISSISILLRAGGSFPPDGYRSHLTPRDCQIDGPVLADADTMISKPSQVGAEINARFDFPELVSVSRGRRLIIQWTSPEPYQGVQFLSWALSKGNSYSDGYSLSACAGGRVSQPDLDRDYIFEVIGH